MLLNSLQLKNFLSHQDTVLKFKKNQKILIDGVSGSGKSSIADAIVWAFYGKGRVDNRFLIKSGAKYAEVILYVENEDVTTIIRRKVDKEGKQTLTVIEFKGDEKPRPVPITGIKAMQEYIDKEITGSSYELFINSVVYPQESTESFVRQTASKRKDLLLEVAKASYFDEYLEKAKDKHMLLSLDKAMKEADISSSTMMLAREAMHMEKGVAALEQKPTVERQIKDLIEKEKEFDEHYIQNEILTSNTSALVRTLWAHKDALTGLLVDQKQEESKLKSYVPENLEPLKEIAATIPTLEKEWGAIAAHELATNEWNSSRLSLSISQPMMYDYDKIIDEISAQIEKEKNKVFELCPGKDYPCPPVTRERDARLEELEERLEIKQELKEEYVKKLEAYVASIRALGEAPVLIHRDKSKVMSDLKLAREAEAKLNLILATEDTTTAVLKQKVAGLVQEEEKLRITISSLEKEVDEMVLLASAHQAYLSQHTFDYTLKNRTVDQLALIMAEIKLANEAKERYNELNASLDTYRKELLVIEERLEAITLLKTALGPNGIKAVVIDYIVPQLENRINSILEKMSDFRVRMDTQRTNANGDKRIEGLFIYIYNGQGAELDFDSFSGGERVKISFAITESLAEIQNAKFRVLDEAVNALDQESITTFTDVVMGLQERFPQIICISHLPEVKSLFNEKITVSKVNGTSRIC